MLNILHNKSSGELYSAVHRHQMLQLNFDPQALATRANSCEPTSYISCLFIPIVWADRRIHFRIRYCCGHTWVSNSSPTSARRKASSIAYRDVTCPRDLGLFSLDNPPPCLLQARPFALDCRARKYCCFRAPTKPKRGALPAKTTSGLLAS